MKAILPLEEMSKIEKLRMMEELWADLSRFEDDVESPAWHENVLKQREEKVKEGKESYISWKDAKKILRERRT